MLVNSKTLQFCPSILQVLLLKGVKQYISYYMSYQPIYLPARFERHIQNGSKALGFLPSIIPLSTDVTQERVASVAS